MLIQGTRSRPSVLCESRSLDEKAPDLSFYDWIGIEAVDDLGLLESIELNDR